ncbi:hypothetical protein Hanom_Chr05g00438641 [Helianthus anomalus]
MINYKVVLHYILKIIYQIFESFVAVFHLKKYPKKYQSSTHVTKTILHHHTLSRTSHTRLTTQSYQTYKPDTSIHHARYPHCHQSFPYRKSVAG